MRASPRRWGSITKSQRPKGQKAATRNSGAADKQENERMQQRPLRPQHRKGRCVFAAKIVDFDFQNFMQNASGATQDTNSLRIFVKNNDLLSAFGRLYWQ
jgi:hypothetical protein